MRPTPAVILTFALGAVSARPSRGGFSLEDGVFVHLFEWSHADVAQECEDFLGPKGFAAVQISPPMEHIQGNQWWTRYQPVSYTLTSRSGTQSELEDMISRCKAAGVRIIADAVVNHMAAAPQSTSTGVAGTPYNPGRQYEPYDYNPDMTHHLDGQSTTNCAISDYDDMQNVQTCDLSGLVDLDTENSEVQSTIADYLSSLTAAGAVGVRIDAAKHISNYSVAAILDKAQSLEYVFQEVIYGSGEAVQPEMYTATGDVTEFRFGTNIFDNFNSKTSDNMKYMATFGEAWGMLPSSSAVVFTDNHDTQRSSSEVLTYKDGENYNLANYFMLAHPYGHPKVMSSYYFTDSDAGPPGTPVHGSDGSVSCDDGVNWVCEHRRTGIANMVGFRKAAAGTNATNWQFDPTNANRVAFSREDAGFFALNMDPSSSWEASVPTDLADGTYCNAITSDDADLCDGGEQVTVAQGSAYVSLAPLSALAMYSS